MPSTSNFNVVSLCAAQNAPTPPVRASVLQRATLPKPPLLFLKRSRIFRHILRKRRCLILRKTRLNCTNQTKKEQQQQPHGPSNKNNRQEPLKTSTTPSSMESIACHLCQAWWQAASTLIQQTSADTVPQYHCTSITPHNSPLRVIVTKLGRTPNALTLQ